MTVVLALHALVCVLVQLQRPWAQRLRRIDRTRLLPLYALFVPRPPAVDLHLLFRDAVRGTPITPWQPVVPMGRRRWWHGFLDVRRRRKKTAYDVSVFLSRTAQDVTGASLPETPAYRCALDLARTADHSPGAETTEFAITMTRSTDPLDQYGVVVMRSSRHEL